jgi:hypothetical protein
VERLQGNPTITALEKYRKYQATITLSGLEVFVHNLMVREKIMNAGFSNVVVEGTGDTRLVTGVWSRDRLPLSELPRQISDIKEL